MKNIVEERLSVSSPLILDGGLSTELEARGHRLNDALWSARLLVEDPESIRAVHGEFLRSGADIITTVTYQATLQGFSRYGFKRSEAEALIRLAVQCAIDARDTFWASPSHRARRQRPLVAASIGPYGAYLANGAEYTGAYDLDQGGLAEFHQERLDILADTKADLFALETLPRLDEALALLSRLEAYPDAGAWISFSARDEGHIADGTPFSECVQAIASHPQVIAVGINCTSPQFISPLVRIARDRTDKPVIVYPNSGEDYDANTKNWAKTHVQTVNPSLALEWRSLGATLIGGCCRVRPAQIRELRQALFPRSPGPDGSSPA